MQGHFLKLYVPQTTKYQGQLLFEWILEQARRLGIPGGSALRAIAGFGRHGRLHEEQFFELAEDLPIVLEFYGDADAVDALLAKLAGEEISLFYLRLPAEGGFTLPPAPASRFPTP